MNSKRVALIGVVTLTYIVLSVLYLFLLITAISKQETFDNTHGMSCLIVNETVTKADGDWFYELSLQTPNNGSFVATAECDEPNCYTLNSPISCWENFGEYSLDSPSKVEAVTWAYIVILPFMFVCLAIETMELFKRGAMRDSNCATYDTAYAI